MTSWQRRMTAVERRFTFHDGSADRTADDGGPAAGTAPATHLTEVDIDLTTTVTVPSSAARLAALLRDQQRAEASEPAALAGTA